MNSPASSRLCVKFLSACEKNGISPTQFILTINIAEQNVSLFEDSVAAVYDRRQKEKAIANSSAVADRRYNFVKKISCSTSRFGIGQTEGSNCTPLGLHRIAEKIGAGERAGTVFKARKVIGFTNASSRDASSRAASGKEVATRASLPLIPDAKITTRILWLEGLEDGFNRGGNVDSHARYIYIHGTADQKSIGKPSSHGCIHLADTDLIPLFDLLPGGTLVWISEN